MANLNGRENEIREGNSYGLPIVAYDNYTEDRVDTRRYASMEDFFEAYPSAEVTLIEAVGGEVRVYC